MESNSTTQDYDAQRINEISATRFILFGITKPEDRQDPETFFAAVKRVPESTTYKAVDLTVNRTDSGLTFVFCASQGKPEEFSVTFDEIESIIKAYRVWPVST